MNVSSSSFRGFSTLELMIALMILTTTISAGVLIMLGIPGTLADSHTRQIAVHLAENALQLEFRSSENSFSSIVSIATTTSGSYSYSLSVSTLPDDLSKILTNYITWIDSHGKLEYFALTGLVTNFREKNQNACNSDLSGNWTSPQSTSLYFPYPFETVAAMPSMLVASVLASASRSDPNLFFFSTASSTNPTLIGSLDTSTSTNGGFAALAPNGNILYGASSYTPNFNTCLAGPACSQIQVIDTTDPTHTSVITNFKLSTSSAPFAGGSGGQSSGKSLFYSNGFLYVGLQKTASSIGIGDEFNIINVTDPRNPIWVGGYAVGRTVNQITVADGYAYLATDDTSKELIVLDVHTPGHITFVGSYDAPGNTAFGFGEAVALMDASSSSSTPAAILGRSYIQNEPQFTILSISPFESPTVLGSEPVSATSSDSIEDIFLEKSKAFILTNTPALQIWNVSNVAQPIPSSPDISLPGGSVSTNSAVCQGNSIYVASGATSNSGYLTAIYGS